MRALNVKRLLLGAIMLIVAALPAVVKPTDRMSARRPAPVLETAVPRHFKGWREDARVKPIQLSPDVQAQLNKIYSQTLSRTYINDTGQRVMLSIAYGGDQGRAVQVHKPEVCYPMQGFQILSIAKSVMSTVSGEIPIMRLVAAQGKRVEPITYWIAVGDVVVRGAFEQNLARIRYGLTGTVPDGMLVRVSTISQNEASAYQVHDQFVSDMLQAMRAEDAARLLGRFAG
jgi:EpsI family protein